jgi:transposase
MRCSSDLRKRVINFVQSGGSKRDAARRFGVGEASVYRWIASGKMVAGKPGPKAAHKLDMAALAQNVLEHNDWTQAERAHHFGVSRGCIWFALRRMNVRRKKNDAVSAGRSSKKEVVPAPEGTIRTAREALHLS